MGGSPGGRREGTSGTANYPGLLKNRAVSMLWEITSAFFKKHRGIFLQLSCFEMANCHVGAEG